MSIEDVVLNQKRELERRLAEPYVPRDVAPPAGDNDLMRVVMGPRRAGKSFFAMHHLRAQGGFGYANFDDERLADLPDADRLVAAVNQAYGNPRHLLLDEVQNRPRWELLVNRLQRQGVRLWVTGSNAHLLSREPATHLTGRHLPLTILPFSFGEYLRARGGTPTASEQRSALTSYLADGGLPETVVKDLDRRQYCATLLDSVLYRDIVMRAGIRGQRGLGELTRYLLSNVAREYSLRRLTGVAGVRGVMTVDRYLKLLEEAFLLFSLQRFSHRVREQARANRKIYCIDNGFVSAGAFLSGPEWGRLCENLVAVALWRLRLERRAEVFFWRSPQHDEVDFVVRKGPRVVQLLQVCWDPGPAGTKEREVRALLKAGRELGCGDLRVLTADVEGEEPAEWFGLKARVRFVPVWKWLCNYRAPERKK